MKKNKDQWGFVTKQSRPTLTSEQIRYFRDILRKTLKVGLEFEFNLKEYRGGCHGNNDKCRCTAVFMAENGEPCFSQCIKKGNCSIEREHGCAGIYCVEFTPPCSTCPKFSRACALCPKRHDPTKDPDSIRKNIVNELEPTRFLAKLGKHGVLDVVKDGSLVGGGVEVVTVGRRVHFWKMYNMCKKITSEAVKHNATVDERCSLHLHLLSGYLSGEKYNTQGNHKHYGLPREASGFEIKEIEEKIPEIVLANFHQLWRRYENAIIWMTSALGDRDHLTRWIKFRKSMLKYSAVRKNMKSVVDEIKQTGDHARYMMVNYNPTKFDENGDLSQLHLEVRAPDGTMSAAVATSLSCLFYAMLLKAVDLSRYGIIEGGGKEYMDQSRHISERLINNNGSWNGPRTSSTEEIHPYIPELQKQADELIGLVKNTLLDLQPAYDILTQLAAKPVSLRLCDGDSWDKIEQDLMQNASLCESSNEALIKTIDLGTITQCDNLSQWLEAVAEDTGLDSKDLDDQVGGMINTGRAFWSDRLGSMVLR